MQREFGGPAPPGAIKSHHPKGVSRRSCLSYHCALVVIQQLHPVHTFSSSLTTDANSLPDHPSFSSSHARAPALLEFDGTRLNVVRKQTIRSLLHSSSCPVPTLPSTRLRQLSLPVSTPRTLTLRTIDFAASRSDGSWPAAQRGTYFYYHLLSNNLTQRHRDTQTHRHTYTHTHPLPPPLRSALLYFDALCRVSVARLDLLLTLSTNARLPCLLCYPHPSCLVAAEPAFQFFTLRPSLLPLL